MATSTISKALKKIDQPANLSKSNNEYSNNYRMINWGVINRREMCNCGGSYTHKNKMAHYKTSKHIAHYVSH
jgi:competence protein ComGF